MKKIWVFMPTLWLAITFAVCLVSCTDSPSDVSTSTSRFEVIENHPIGSAWQIIRDIKTGRIYMFGPHIGFVEINQQPLKLEGE